jgi:hypothetical protein
MSTIAVSKCSNRRTRKLDLDHIHQFQERISAVQLDPLEVSKTVYKYFQMEAKTMKALRRIRVDVPSNVESLSPERLEFLDRLYQDSKKVSAASKSFDGK